MLSAYTNYVVNGKVIAFSKKKNKEKSRKTSNRNTLCKNVSSSWGFADVRFFGTKMSAYYNDVGSGKVIAFSKTWNTSDINELCNECL